MMPSEAFHKPSSVTDTVPTTVPWERVERFVGQVAHDLRNGLNACELQLTFLAEISTDPDAVEEIKRLRETVSGMTKQLQNLRVATGGANAHTLEYPAADLLEDLQERFAKLHPEFAGRVDWQHAPDGELLALVDPELTLAAGLELLRNALHFAPKDARVTCRVRPEEERVVFGFEHPLAEAPSLPPESWGKTPLNSTRRGTYGLGLFRARRTLEAQGGELRFTYSPESQRLLATISLPRATAS